ncbi:(2Fe-2S)-binding protein [Knoellia sp. CPCC 206453]|uniref:(2Fe-2S)-binding protein n=1 Tax=Knoellia pratensis TaxID=3404796 RepID=UPI0036083B87
MNTRLYADPSPPQVASAFVLQHLLSIPAQVSAFAAVTGPWLVDLGTLDDSGISCDLAPGLYPQRLGFLRVNRATADLEERIGAARAAYRDVGLEIADRYDGGVKVSSRQRLGMVEDLWEMAVREARGAVGQGLGAAVERQSCCFIYALPGCHECAGCPRLSPQG